MIWPIAKKELLLNLLTFKFIVGTLLSVIIVIASTPILVNDYQGKLIDHSENVTSNEMELGKVMVYESLTPTVYRPPTALSVFNKGIAEDILNSVKIKLDNVPQIEVTSESLPTGIPKLELRSTDRNPYLAIFPVLDVSLVFKIVISFLALLMAYDVISGERERGTLSLLLSNPVARYQVLLGKLLAGLITLFIPVTIAFLTVLLILLLSPMVDLAGTDCGRIALMYFISLIFVSVMYNLSLLFTCLTKNSTSSLIFVLLIWATSAFVVPNGSPFLAEQLFPTESRAKLNEQIKSLIEEYENKVAEFQRENQMGGQIWSRPPDAFGNLYFSLCDKQFLKSFQKFYAWLEPRKIEYASKIWAVQENYLSRLHKQELYSDYLSLISPISLYENLMARLVGTDLLGLCDFVTQAKTYRSEVIEYIQSKTDSFSSSCYFTPCTEQESITYERYLDTGNKADRKNVELAFEQVKKRLLENPPILNLGDFPRFIYESEDVAKSLQKTMSDLLLLFFFGVIFFAVSFVAFLKYDVRQ